MMTLIKDGLGNLVNWHLAEAEAEVRSAAG
jgi:hypothetical protein